MILFWNSFAAWMRSGTWKQEEKKTKKIILAIRLFQICEMISETYVQKLAY